MARGPRGAVAVKQKATKAKGLKQTGFRGLVVCLMRSYTIVPIIAPQISPNRNFSLFIIYPPPIDPYRPQQPQHSRVLSQVHPSALVNPVVV